MPAGETGGCKKAKTAECVQETSIFLCNKRAGTVLGLQCGRNRLSGKGRLSLCCAFFMSSGNIQASPLHLPGNFPNRYSRFDRPLTTTHAKKPAEPVLERLRGLFVLPHLLCTSDDKWLETAIFRQQSGNSDLTTTAN